MTFFAHNGVDHSTKAEAISHSAVSTVLTVIGITAAALLFIGLCLYLLKRFAAVELPNEEEQE